MNGILLYFLSKKAMPYQMFHPEQERAACVLRFGNKKLEPCQQAFFAYGIIVALFYAGFFRDAHKRNVAGFAFMNALLVQQAVLFAAC